MKKLILLFVVMIFVPQIVFAVQGTCSSHGGVNCHAGADYDGSAICNDGWRDSSEYYYDTAICSNVKHSCYEDQWEKLMREYDVYSLQEQEKEL